MKSLKLVILITAIALVPLGLGVMVFKQSEQAQVEQDAALESEAGAAAARLRDSVAETRVTVLITAHNPSFRDFYRAGGDRYPDGRAGEGIPLGARIIALCDAYDAMIGPRPYRLGMSDEVAHAELRRCAGEQFDPAIVEVFCEMLASGRPEAQRSLVR